MSKVSLVTISEDANLFGGEPTAQLVHFETKRKTEIKYFSEENNLSEQMKDEAAYPDSTYLSSSAEMQNEIEGCEDFDDNGAPSGSHCECPGPCKEQESTATADDRPPITTTEDNAEKEEEEARASTKEESRLPWEDGGGSDVNRFSDRRKQDKCSDERKARELTTDERPGEGGTRAQKGGGGGGGGEEEKVKTLTGESSVTTVDTLTANTSQLKLTEQKKKQNCKKKSKRPKASIDVAAGQDISKREPTAAATGAVAVPETPIPTDDAATTAASAISSNKGKPLSPLSFHNHLTLVSIILTVFGQMQGASGILTKPPANVLAKSGTEVRLRCSTDLTDPVYWLRRLYGNSETQTLYYGAFGFSSSVNGRFRIDGSRSSGSYDVIISRVRAEDAGVYICQDDGGMGERKEMELVVFEYFNCTMPMPPVGFMEKNDIADDVIRASCRIKYHGNQKPRFQWTWSDTSTVNSTEEDSESTTIVSTAMTRPRKELNGAKLTCTATVSDRSNAQDSSSSSSSAQWTSHEVTVLHASLLPGNVDQCKGSSLILVCNSECEYLEVQLGDGLCQCSATYRRSEDLQREFAFSVYPCAAGGSSWNTLIYIIPIAVGVAMVTSAIAAIFVIRRKNEGKGNPDEEKHLKDNGSPGSSV